MNNTFFTWVWRINGLILGALLLWVLFFVLGDLIQEAFDRDTPRSGLTVAGDPSDEEAVLSLRAPIANTNPGIYVLPLAVQSTKSAGSDLSISSKFYVRQNNVLNYQVVNAATETTAWLFDTNAQIIVETREVKPPNFSSTSQVMGHILSVVETDTNGDEYLTREDLITLYFVPRDWGSAKPIATDIEDVLSIKASSVASVDIIMTDASGTRLKRFGLPILNVTAEVPLQ